MANGRVPSNEEKYQLRTLERLYGLRLNIARAIDLFRGLVINDSHIGMLPAAQVMLVCHDASRGYVYKGKRYAQLLDSINDKFIEYGINTVTVASPFSRLHGKEAYGNVFLVNSLFVRANFKEVLLRIILPKRFDQRRASIETWRLILEKINPKIIIGIQPSPALCMAAKSLGIWVADLQHGVISDKGYYGLQDRAHLHQQGWPSCILCWNQSSADRVKVNADNLVSTLVVGNPWFIRFLYPNPKDELVNKNYLDDAKRTGVMPVILITLQWGYEDHEAYSDVGIPEGLLDFMKSKEAEKYIWWIRVHPLLFAGKGRQRLYEALSKRFRGLKHIEWQVPTEMSLPEVLSRADLHVTSSSAVTIEASWFGIRTALIGGRKKELEFWFKDEICSKYAAIISKDSDSISNWIKKNITIKKIKNQELVKRCDSFNKMMEALVKEINSA